MLDECTHTAEGGLEGARPIGGLFRNIKENLHAVYDSLLLCYEPLSRWRVDHAEGVETAHIDLDLGYSRTRKSSLGLVFEA